MLYFNLFVYGTLLHQFRGKQFFEGLVATEGKITGNLYHHSSGVPVIEIPNNPTPYVSGSAQYTIDIEAQDSMQNSVKMKFLPLNIKYGRVYGELYKIPYTDGKINKTLDRYERFNPDANSLYKRSLVPVQTKEGIIWAWVYHMETIPDESIRILTGDWRDCFYPNAVNHIQEALNEELDKLDDEYEDDEYDEEEDYE